MLPIVLLSVLWVRLTRWEERSLLSTMPTRQALQSPVVPSRLATARGRFSRFILTLVMWSLAAMFILLMPLIVSRVLTIPLVIVQDLLPARLPLAERAMTVLPSATAGSTLMFTDTMC